MLQALEQKLLDAVSEAKAFAAQQQADADRTKRSFSQANLRAGDSDVEMKRMRESDDNSEVSLLPVMSLHCALSCTAHAAEILSQRRLVDAPRPALVGEKHRAGLCWAPRATE